MIDFSSRSTKKDYFVANDGGSCSGKTTLLSAAPQKLWEAGVRPWILDEKATRLIHPGIPDISHIASNNRSLFIEIERAMAELYLYDYAFLKKLAGKFPEKNVILSDRFVPGIAAYVESDEYEKIIASLNHTQEQLMQMCDGVICLVTAAYGAESFYNLNNPARIETTLEEARIQNDRSIDAWREYGNLRIIDNSTGFDKKIDRALQALFQIVGVPVPLYQQRKFLLHHIPHIPLKVQTFKLEQLYLIPDADNTEPRIRKWGTNGFQMYTQALKKPMPGNKILQTQHMISEHTYNALTAEKDPGTRVIRKMRHCFVHNHQYFKIDQFLEPRQFFILEIEPTQENEKIDLPPFIPRPIKEVTDDIRYSNYYIARHF